MGRSKAGAKDEDAECWMSCWGGGPKPELLAPSECNTLDPCHYWLLLGHCLWRRGFCRRRPLARHCLRRHCPRRRRRVLARHLLRRHGSRRRWRVLARHCLRRHGLCPRVGARDKFTNTFTTCWHQSCTCTSSMSHSKPSSWANAFWTMVRARSSRSGRRRTYSSRGRLQVLAHDES